MPATRLIVPVLSTLATFTRLSHPNNLHTLLRSTGYKLRPPKPTFYQIQTTENWDKCARDNKLSYKAKIFCEKIAFFHKNCVFSAKIAVFTVFALLSALPF